MKPITNLFKSIVALSFCSFTVSAVAGAEELPWKADTARTVLTPEQKAWLAGYGYKREPIAVLHDILVKVLALEENHPGTTALFFTACGADQNLLPRREVELCEQYGSRLVEEVR